MATKRDKDRLARLDKEIAMLRYQAQILAAMYPGTILQGHVNKDVNKLDEQRRALRERIKKHTGDGVGGSARRRTRRSVGSSPTPPTTQNVGTDAPLPTFRVEREIGEA